MGRLPPNVQVGLVGMGRARTRPALTGAARSGQVYYSAEVQDHEGPKAEFTTSEVTSLESSYARIFRDDTAEPTTNVAEDHNDVLHAADL